MRVLFTSQPGAGHWHPLIGVAWALETAGHQVAFATTPQACAAIEANGITCFPVGRDESDEEFQKRRRFQAGFSPAEQAAYMVGQVFAGVAAERALSEMMAGGRT